MATNRDVLKQAIADAKTVKETAIVNAKAALEETFAPYLREKLAAKLAEMDSMDEEMDETEGMEENKALDASKKQTGYKELAKRQAMTSDHYHTMEEEMEEGSGYDEKAKIQAMTADHYHTMEEESKSMDEELEELLRELESF